jgi:hypothetical protein
MGLLSSTFSRGTAGPSLSVRRAAALAALVAVLASIVVAGAPEARSAGELTEVGRVAFPPDPDEFSAIRGRLVIDSGSRRGFRLYRNPDTGELTVWGLDLDTLADGARIDVPGFPAAPALKYGFHATAGGGRLFAVDEVGWVHVFDQASLHRVDLWPSILPPPSGSTVSVLQREQEQQARRSELPRSAVHPLVALPGHRITAFEYVPALDGSEGGELLTVSLGYVNEVDVPFSVVTLHRWDAATGQEISTTRLSGCAGGRGFGNETRASTGIAVANLPDGGRELIYGCVGRGLVGEVWRAAIGGDGAVAGEQQVATVATASDFLIDAVGRRAHAITSSGVGQSLVAVDLDRGGVVGAVGLSFAFEAAAAPGGVGAAIDPTTGRFYAQGPGSSDAQNGKASPGGLVLVDGRRAPLPQGFAFTDMSAEAGEMVVVDPATANRPTRLFVRRLGEPFYRVLADAVPVQGDPVLADADRFTTDVTEKDGVTRASFAGGANGYGARMLLLGGLNAVPDPVSSVRGESFTKDMLTGFVAAPGCGGTNRELILASVEPTTGLSDTAATAVAAAAVADPRTIQDLAQPVASCSPSLLSRTTLGRSRTHPDDFTLGTNAWQNTTVPGSDDNVDQAVGPTWPFSFAVCLPPAQAEDEAPHDGDAAYDGSPPPPGFTARTVCNIEDQKLVAEAESAFADLAGISIGRATSRTTIQRQLGKGVVVTVESRVDDVDLAGVASIREVRSTAVSTAAGRPGTATTSFTSAVCGLRAPGLTIEACFDPRSPQSRELIAGLNQALAFRQMQVRVPQPDGELASGTPGGALSAVQKDRFAAQGEQLFNNDFLTAVPALELIRLHDSTQGRGRQIVQLAGAQASTAYNVSVVPTGSGSGAAPSAVPVGTDVLSAGPAAPSGSIAGPGGGGFPSLARILQTVVATTTFTLRYALRSPGKALSVAGLIFVAFALPLHLLERRRAFTAALSQRS